MRKVQLLDGATAVNDPPVAVAATGSITTVAVADIVDGEHFSLNDGRGGNLKFVFDKDGTFDDAVVGRPVIKIDLSAITTADEVRDAIVTAVNTAPIAITAAADGAATVALTNQRPGEHGNQPAQESVANATFAVSGMSDGELSGVSIVKLRQGRDAAVGANVLLSLVSTAGTGDLSVTARLWVFSFEIGVWTPFGTGTDGAKGQLNGGTSIGETGDDQIAHTEVISGLQGFDRAYLEIEAKDGASLALDAWLVPHAA